MSFLPKELKSLDYYLDHLPLYFKTATGIEERVSFAVQFLNDYVDAMDAFYSGYSGVIEKVKDPNFNFLSFYYAKDENDEYLNKYVTDIFIDLLCKTYDIPDVLCLQYEKISDLTVPEEIETKKTDLRALENGNYIFPLTQWQKLLLVNRALLANGYNGSRKMLMRYSETLEKTFKLSLVYDENQLGHVCTWLDVNYSSQGLVPAWPNNDASTNKTDRTLTDELIEKGKQLSFDGATAVYGAINDDDDVSRQAEYFFTMILLLQNDYFVIKSLGLTYDFAETLFIYAGRYEGEEDHTEDIATFTHNRFNFFSNEPFPNSPTLLWPIDNLNDRTSSTSYSYSLNNLTGEYELDNPQAFNTAANNKSFVGKEGIGTYRIGAVHQ